MTERVGSVGIEIERKFLVMGNEWRKNAGGSRIRQGYLNLEIERSVRIRTIADRGYITIKGKGQYASRPEFEYEIPCADADEMLDTLCVKPLIEKRRYVIKIDWFEWEIDEFFGENEGLILAEIELPETEAFFTKPPWLGKEVTGDKRYFNLSLMQHPFKRW